MFEVINMIIFLIWSLHIIYMYWNITIPLICTIVICQLRRGGKGDHKGCTYVGMCVWNGLLKSTEVTSYSPKAENVNILFKKHFHASNLWRSQGHWLMLRTEKTLCYLGLIFKHCIIVMAECRVWGAGGTEKGMCTFVGVNVCVHVCLCWLWRFA